MPDNDTQILAIKVPFLIHSTHYQNEQIQSSKKSNLFKLFEFAENDKNTKGSQSEVHSLEGLF
jgi:hypothetical protein